MNLQKFDVQVSGHYPDEDDRIYGNDGEFVDADIAQDLYEALAECYKWLEESADGERATKMALRALAKARGEGAES